MVLNLMNNDIYKEEDWVHLPCSGQSRSWAEDAVARRACGIEEVDPRVIGHVKYPSMTCPVYSRIFRERLIKRKKLRSRLVCRMEGKENGKNSFSNGKGN